MWIGTRSGACEGAGGGGRAGLPEGGKGVGRVCLRVGREWGGSACGCAWRETCAPICPPVVGPLLTCPPSCACLSRFDDVFDDTVNNELLYAQAIQPLIATIFK
jgi:hypothetical protein